MKVKKIEKLCKEAGCIYLYDEPVETLGAVYNAAGVAAEQEKMKI